MIVKEQKEIKLINTCGAILREEQLKAAILWYSPIWPVARLKRVFLHGRYPAVSIHGKKLHVHRLLMMWFLDRKRLPRKLYVHHENGDKLDARPHNLTLMDESTHQSHHNAGKVVSLATRRKLTETNKKNWATKWKHRRIKNPALLKEAA